MTDLTPVDHSMIASAPGDPVHRSGPEILVNTTTTGHQREPVITALSTGGFVIVWLDWSDFNIGRAITAQFYDANGARVGTEIQLDATPADQFNISVTADNAGGYIVAWVERIEPVGGLPEFTIKAQQFDALGKGGTVIPIQPMTTTEVLSPDISTWANGNFVITWTRYADQTGDFNPPSINAQIYDATGASIGPEFQVNTATPNEQHKPAVATLSTGGFVVTWEDWSGLGGDVSEAAIKAQMFDAGGGRVGAEVLVNLTTLYSQHGPSVVALSNGGFVITWSDLSGTGNDGTAVRAQLFGADGNKVGTEFQVSTTASNRQEAPQIAALADGGFVVTWQDWSGRNDDLISLAVRAQVFDATGNKVGSEFLVNSTTANHQEAPVIATLSSGDFVIAWADWSERGGDNDGLSTKAQLFTFGPNDPPTITSNGGGDAAALSIVENSASVATVTALDTDGSSIIYSISGGADANLFEIGQLTGLLTFIAAPDFEIPRDSGYDNLYDVVVRAFDGFLFDEQAFAITVTNNGSTIYGTDSDDVIDQSTTVSGQPFPTDGEEDIFGLTGDDELSGLGGDDRLFGGDGNDTLAGGSGKDTLIGNLGDDRMSGGPGDDIYSVNSISDVVIEAPNEGNDTVFSDVTFTLSPDIETLILVGSDPVNGTGNDGRNILIGNDNDNVLVGGFGDDGLIGGGGNDTLIGGGGTDGMAGGAGDDRYSLQHASDVFIENPDEGNDTVFAETGCTLYADVESLILVNSINATWGTGNSQQNWIYGNSMSNRLEGAGQADYLIGGGGNDTFNLRIFELHGDMLGDFGAGDLIQFWGYGAATTKVVQIDSIHYRIQDSATGATEVFSITGGYTLTPADYVFA